MTHCVPYIPDQTFLVCTPDEFLAASPDERRKLVLTQIDAHPETHNQRHWGYAPIFPRAKDTVAFACGTTFCIAGWAVTLAGGEMEWDIPSGVWIAQWVFNGHELDPEITPGTHSVEWVAGKLLGLDTDDAHNLFHTTGNETALTQLKETLT